MDGEVPLPENWFLASTLWMIFIQSVDENGARSARFLVFCCYLSTQIGREAPDFGCFFESQPKIGREASDFGCFFPSQPKIGREAPDFGCFRAADAAADEAVADAHAADAEPCLRHETLPCSAMALSASMFIKYE